MISFQSKAKNFLMRQLTLQRMAACFGGLPRVDKWVFIIDCYNSGTTLLARLLERHSQVRAMPGEGVAFTDGLLRPEEFGWPRLWYRCQQQMQVDSNDQLELANRIKKQWGYAASGSGPRAAVSALRGAIVGSRVRGQRRPAVSGQWLASRGQRSASGPSCLGSFSVCLLL